jgi:hypothetical protein
MEAARDSTDVIVEYRDSANSPVPGIIAAIVQQIVDARFCA